MHCNSSSETLGNFREGHNWGETTCSSGKKKKKKKGRRGQSNASQRGKSQYPGQNFFSVLENAMKKEGEGGSCNRGVRGQEKLLKSTREYEKKQREGNPCVTK